MHAEIGGPPPESLDNGDRPNTRDSTSLVHDALRHAILTGELPAGQILSQLQIAKGYSVSRGPVREALRLLEREGLIDATVNHRPRVASFSLEDLEQLYAVRIVTEGLATAVTVPRLSDDDFREIDATLEEMDELDELAQDDRPRWENRHRHFHRLLVQHSGARTLNLINQFYDHSDRYRRAYQTTEPRVRSIAAAEHHQMVEAARAGEAAIAASMLARHLARTALTLLVVLAPEHEPVMVRAAVRQIIAASPEATLGNGLEHS
jgi:DNA-binding GntR family transcriptional regulator